MTGIGGSRIRWDEKTHGAMDWADYGAMAEKPKRGYYTVVCNIRNRWWVCEGYFYNGSGWVTSRNSLTNTVIRYLPSSRQSEFGRR